MRKIIIKTFSIAVALFVIILPLLVSAQGIENPLKAGNSIPEIIKSFMNYLVRVGGVVATFAFIWAGFLYVRARGNPEELKTAKEVFLNTCIGVAILLGANLIATVITNTIGGITGANTGK